MKCAILGFLFSFLGLAFTSSSHAAETTGLDKKQQAMVAMAAFSAIGDLENLKPALHEGLDAGLTINEIKEILVQLYAYAGFPRSLNALTTFMAVLDERLARGIKDEVGREPSALAAHTDSLAFGTDNQTRLIGARVGGGLYDFAPAIDQFLKAHLFGDIFGRDNLDWMSRELVTVAILASIEGLGPQLRGHYVIGMRNGLTPEQLAQTVELIASKIGPGAGDNAREALNAVLEHAPR